MITITAVGQPQEAPLELLSDRETVDFLWAGESAQLALLVLCPHLIQHCQVPQQLHPWTPARWAASALGILMGRIGMQMSGQLPRGF